MPLPMLIAALSLIVDAPTYFLTQLRPALIRIHLGPGVEVGYDAKGNADVGLPSTFIDESNRTGIVRSAAITLRRRDDSRPNFFFRWDDFMGYESREKCG